MILLMLKSRAAPTTTTLRQDRMNELQASQIIYRCKKMQMLNGMKGVDSRIGN